MNVFKTLKDLATGQYETRSAHHAKCIVALDALNADLTFKSESEYTSAKEEIKDCPKCKVQPTHLFDSRGMPMDALKCPKCGKSFSRCKDMRGVISGWNAGKRNKYYDEKQDWWDQQERMRMFNQWS